MAKGDKMDAYLLREAFEQMGVTYIKLGRFIASTPSIFPKAYVLAFQGCLDQTAPVRFEQIRQVLIDELETPGRGLGDIFLILTLSLWHLPVSPKCIKRYLLMADKLTLKSKTRCRYGHAKPIWGAA